MTQTCLNTARLLIAIGLCAAGCGPEQKPASPSPATPPPQTTTARPDNNALPPGHPEIDMSKMPLPAGALSQTGNPKWVVPDRWTPGPESTVRRGSFLVKGAGEFEGQTADIAVTVFPGDVGGLLMNINRWRSQIGLEPIKEDQVATLSSKIEVDGKAVTLVDLKDGKPAEGKTVPQRMLVGTLMHEGNSWFVKMTGDAPLVEEQRKAFEAFVNSLKF
jgi:hypothetical protein